MASFHYNPFSSESSLNQWNRYLQQREFHNDLKAAIKSQTKAYQVEFQKASAILSSSIDDAAHRQVNAIDNAARQQAESIAQAADVIVGRLEGGFSDLSSKLSDIDASVEQVGIKLEQLGVMLDWRLSVMIDQQRISNLLLENIALLLRIPDVQKERQYHVEQGFKHYKNAALDLDFYQDALENLLEAEKREKTDYLVLHRIGMIYLYAPKLVDLIKAEEYLRRAAKYGIVESDLNAQRTFNILAGDVSKRLAQQSSAPETIKAIAADSYFQAGVACYAQGKFADAIELSGKAFSLLPALLEAGFLKAKALAACGDETQAANIVESVIKAERFYAVKTAADGDLAPKPVVQTLLRKLRDDAVRQAKERIEKCKAKLLPKSEAAPLLFELEPLIERNTYLDALTALDGLTRERKWQTAPPNSSFSIESFISSRWESKSKRHENKAQKQEERARLDAEIQRLVEEQRKQKQIKQQAEAERLLQEQINQLMSQAHAELEQQNKRWFGRDYRQAITLYEQAARLGSEVARRQAEELKARIK